MKKKSDMMSITRNLILLLVIVAAVALAPGARTTLAQTNNCMQDLVSFGLNCTSEDVRVAIYYLIEGPPACVPGEDITVKLQAEMVAGASERYDIGLFVARDGGDALTGSCYQDYLPPPLQPTPPSCTGTPDPNSGTGPYYNAECTDDPADTCGDLPQGIRYLRNLQQITVKCEDSDGNGIADTKTCTSWDNQASNGGNKPSCTSTSATLPGTPAKCRCESVDIAGLEIGGRIIVDKVTNPSGDPSSFSFTTTGAGYAAFSLTDVAVPNDSGALTPGSYSVTESVPEGWNLTNLSCTSNLGTSTINTSSSPTASITLAAGDTVTCTFTNTQQRGHLIVQKTTNPAGDPTVFTISASGTGTIAGGGAGTVTDSTDKDYEVTPGTYSVTETVPAGWDKTSDTCQNVVVAAGETKTCLITNVKRGHLIVQKTTNPAGDPTVFTISASGTGTITGGSAGTVTDATDKDYEVTPGTYSVTETVPASWDKTGDTCQNVVVAAGETKTCLITNVQRGHIVVDKVTVPSGDPGSFGFGTTGAGYSGFSLTDAALPNDSGGLVPGLYSVAEMVPAGWDLTNIVCTGATNSTLTIGASGGFDQGDTGVSINLAAGETINCTFTDTKLGTIVVKKETDPDCEPAPEGLVSWWPGDGNEKDIVGTNDGASHGGATFAFGMVGQAFSFDGQQGSYVEIADANSLDITQKITIDAWIYPTVSNGRIVDKITAGGADGYLLDIYAGKLRLIIDGHIVLGGTLLPLYTSTHVAGVYNGSKLLVYVNGVLDGSFSSNTSIPVNALPLRIGADQEGKNVFNGLIDEVEIFNRDLSAEEIQAIYNAGITGKCKKFGFATDLNPNTFSLMNGESQTFANALPGTYFVTEDLPMGWELTSATCSNGNPVSEIVLDPGETVTCTFKNTQQSKIIVKKVTDPKGDLQSFTFSPSYGGTFNLSDGQSNDSGFLSPGKYSMAESTVPGGWRLTGKTCDNGNDPSEITLGAGKIVTCTFTNTKQGTAKVKKVMVGGTGSFTYTGTPSGTISTNNGTLETSVAPGQYTSTETALAGWYLTSVACDDANSSGSVTTRTATFNVEAGETVTCTFTNTIIKPLTVTKTANTFLTRTYSWTIDKGPDGEYWKFIGDPATSHNYTVKVDRTVTDSNWAVSGDISITNPNPEAVQIQNITDVISGGINATVNCGITFPYSLVAGGTLNCTYEASLPDSTNRTNTATVTTALAASDGSVTVPVSFVNAGVYESGLKSINVTDTNGKSWGPVIDDTTWSYAMDFACPASLTAYSNGVYETTNVNTATISQTSQHDSATVRVHCYVPTISKTANGTYKEVHDWEVCKSVNPTSQTAVAGEKVNFTWTVRVDETVHGEDYLVTGDIVVVNPNPKVPLTVALFDALDDGSVATIGPCSGGTWSSPNLTVPAGGTATCDYSVTPTGAPDGFPEALPDQVTMSITHSYVGGPAYFPEVTISNGGMLNGVYEGWCIDTDRLISEYTNYTAKVYSSYESLPAGLLEHPENLDLVNWIINQNYVGKPAGGSLGNYTYGDVQLAIWTLIEDQVWTAGLGPYSQARVNQILAAAHASGEGFVPACGDVIAVILVPVYGGEPIAQPIIAQVSFISIGFDCADINNVTAKLNGIEFKASAEILWTAIPINPTAQLDDDQKSGWPITISGDQTFTYTDPQGYTCSTNPAAYTNNFYQYNESNTAVLTFSTGSKTATASTAVKCYALDITVTKTASPTSVPETGGNVTFNFVVHNTGGAAVTLNSLVDNKLGNLNGQGTCGMPQTIAAEGNYSCSLTAFMAGEPNTPHVNVVTAIAHDNGGNTDTATDDAKVTFTNVLPTIALAKSANPASLPEPGGNVEFTVVVTNNSFEPVTLTSLTDNKYGSLSGKGTCTTGGSIAASASYTCKFTGAVSGEPGSHTDTVTAVARDNDGTTVTKTATATVTLTNVTPTISVTKTPYPTSLPEPGGSVQFTVVVTNNSFEAVTLTSLTDNVYGNLSGKGTCATGGSIAKGGSYTCRFTGAVSGEPGNRTDTVTAVARDNDGTTDTKTATATVTLTNVTPTISVTKTPYPTNLPEPGGNVQFTVVVKNNSFEPVTLTSLTDNVYGNLSGKGTCATGGSIVKAGSYTCKFTGVVSGEPGNHTDTITAVATDNDGTTDTKTATATVMLTNVLPTIAVSKSANPASLPEPGGNVQFTVVVTNNSFEPVTLTSLTDNVYGSLSGKGACATGASIAANASYSCEFTGAVSGEPGNQTDTVTAVARDNDGATVTKTATTTVTLTNVLPTIAVSKSANPTSLPEPGGNVQFTVVVTNNSFESVTLTSLTDNVYGSLSGKGTCRTGGSIAANASYTCNFTGAVSGEPGNRTDTVTAVARDNDGTTDTQTATATVMLTNVLPTISVTKTPYPTNLTEPGGNVQFTVVVKNNSFEPVKLTSLTDDVYGNLSGKGTCATGSSITKGGSYTCRFTGAVSGEPGNHTDTVTAVATDNDGTTDTKTATATVMLTNVLPTIAVAKSANPTTLPEPGGDVEFTVVVTNNSFEPVTLTSLTDDVYGNLSGKGTCATGSSIAKGGSYTCRFTGAVSGEPGNHTDTVTAVATDNDGTTVTKTATTTVALTNALPTISMTKSANPTTLPEPGGIFNYTLDIHNTSAEAVTITALNDTNPLSAECQALVGTTLAADASALCTYTATFTDAGDYPNTASVTVKDNENNTASASDTKTVTVTDLVPTVEITTAETPSTSAYLGYSATYLAQGQSFKAAGSNLIRLKVALAKAGSPSSDIKVSIRSTPKGSDLGSATILRSAVTSTSYTNPTWCTAKFSNAVPLVKGNTYWVVLSVTSTSYSNYFRVPIRSGNPYADGAWYKGSSLTADYNYDLLLKLTFGTDTNVEPSQAEIETGPSSGYVDTSYDFTVSATDSEGDKVFYAFDWGDGQTTTTELSSSGTPVIANHVWTEAGSYGVTVRAVDEHGAAGPWSDVWTITITSGTNAPPNPPEAPVGPTTGEQGAMLSFEVSATDPDGDQVSFVVDWGDGTQEQSDDYPSGTAVSLSHAWQNAGSFQIRAYAVDEHGALSSWSPAKTVQINASATEELIISDRPTGGWYLGSAYSRKRNAQSFQTIGTRIVGASVALSRVGSPAQPIQVSIRSTLTGTPLASAEIQPSQVSSIDYRYPDWITVNFPTPAQVTENSACYLVLEVASYDSTSYYKVGYNNTNPYGYGMYYPDSSSTGQSTLDMACKIVFSN